MKRILLLILMILIRLQPGFSQGDNADSLFRLSDSIADLEERILAVLEVSDKRVYSEPEISLSLSQKSLDLIDQKNDRLRARILNRIGAANWSRGELLEALINLQKSNELAKAFADSITITRNLSFLGNVYSMAGDQLTAIDYSLQAMKMYEQLGIEYRRFAMMNNIGKSYLDDDQLDSARKYLEMATSIFDETMEFMLPIFLFNCGELEFKSGNIDKSEILMDSVVNLSVPTNDIRGLSRAYQMQAEILLLRNQHREALSHAIEAYRLGKTTGVKEVVQVCAETLSNAYAALGNVENAYQFQLEALEYEDSLQSSIIKYRLDLSRYNEQDLQIQLLQRTNALREAQSTFRKNIIIVLGFVILVSLVFIYLLYQSRQKIERQKEALDEINQFKSKVFAVVSHDLRSPVQMIVSLSEIISGNMAKPDELQKMLPYISTKVNGLNDLINNLITWARTSFQGEYVEKTTFDATESLKKLIEEVKNVYPDKNVQIHLNVPEKFILDSDEKIFSIIVRNLITNALKFSKENGVVEVTILHENNKIKTFVKDEGIGMDQNQLDKLFTYDSDSRAGTAGESGSGIGLALCKDFVKLLKGDIWAESEPGKGSTFTFVIPKG